MSSSAAVSSVYGFPAKTRRGRYPDRRDARSLSPYPISIGIPVYSFMSTSRSLVTVSASDRECNKLDTAGNESAPTCAARAMANHTQKRGTKLNGCAEREAENSLLL